MDNLISSLTETQKAALKEVLVSNFSAFVKFAFKVRTGQNWISQPHHEVMMETLQKVINGGITRLILVIPPRHSKSELVSIMLPAYAFCVNRFSNTIQTTFSDDLCKEMSSGVRDIIFSEEFTELFGTGMRKDKGAINNWQIKGGGKFHAVPTGGALTGKGCGTTSTGFGGLMVIDDALKPVDAFHATSRNESNRRYTNTLLSRLAKQDETPIVIIAQRLHSEDLPGYLLNGGSGEKFHYLMMPAILTHDCGTIEWYNAQKYSHAIPILYDFGIPEGKEQALWPMRYSLEKLKNLEEGDLYTFNSQYQGRPTMLGGSLFKDEWWQYYDELPHDKIKYLRIYADTAHKTGQQNDFSVFECWAYSSEGNAYLVDLVRGKFEAPELKAQFISFYNKWKITSKYVRYSLNCAKIEDKASGIGLIQELKRIPGMIIVPIQREKDKVTRAMGVAPVIQSGRVHIPRSAPWLEAFQDEVGAFSPMMSHKHDD